MLVYRVERDGIGPYRNSATDSNLWCKITSKKTSDDRRPGPLRDGISPPSKDYYFGFKDIKSLKDWFRGARSALRSRGFNLVIYDVPNEWVRIGTKQVSFKMSKAWPIKTTKIP